MGRAYLWSTFAVVSAVVVAACAPTDPNGFRPKPNVGNNSLNRPTAQNNTGATTGTPAAQPSAAARTGAGSGSGGADTLFQLVETDESQKEDLQRRANAYVEEIRNSKVQIGKVVRGLSLELIKDDSKLKLRSFTTINPVGGDLKTGNIVYSEGVIRKDGDKYLTSEIVFDSKSKSLADYIEQNDETAGLQNPPNGSLDIRGFCSNATCTTFLLIFKMGVTGGTAVGGYYMRLGSDGKFTKIKASEDGGAFGEFQQILEEAVIQARATTNNQRPDQGGAGNGGAGGQIGALGIDFTGINPELRAEIERLVKEAADNEANIQSASVIRSLELANVEGQGVVVNALLTDEGKNLLDGTLVRARSQNFNTAKNGLSITGQKTVRALSSDPANSQDAGYQPYAANPPVIKAISLGAQDERIVVLVQVPVSASKTALSATLFVIKNGQYELEKSTLGTIGKFSEVVAEALRSVPVAN